MPPFIPKADELNQIDRDLRFHPSTVTDPRTFTREQVAAFNRDGYLKPLRIFDAAEMRRHPRATSTICWRRRSPPAATATPSAPHTCATAASTIC